MSLACVTCSYHKSFSFISESAVLNHVCRSDHVSFHTSRSLSPRLQLMSCFFVPCHSLTRHILPYLSFILFTFFPSVSRPLDKCVSLPHDIRLYSPYAKRCVHEASRKRRRQQRQAGGSRVGGWVGWVCWAGRPVVGEWKRVEKGGCQGIRWNGGTPTYSCKVNSASLQYLRAVSYVCCRFSPSLYVRKRWIYLFLCFLFFVFRVLSVTYSEIAVCVSVKIDYVTCILNICLVWFIESSQYLIHGLFACVQWLFGFE